MGHKINPRSFRLPINRDWDSYWFTSNTKNYRDQLNIDIKIRELIEKKFGPQGAIARIVIERTAEKTKITIHSARPGILIGRSGQGIDSLTADIRKQISGKVEVEVVEIKKPDLNAKLVAQSIGQQITRRVPYRKAVKMALQKVMQAGVNGAKICVSGRLNGAEIARVEKFSEGSIPLTSLRANIDFSVYHAQTIYGTVGIKVWICKKAETQGK